jgi:NAD(P)-dependent dehydrogenase (short-subunit alcohol dehydrogenase family)
MRKHIVFGAGGHVGSHIVRQLVANGDYVCAVCHTNEQVARLEGEFYRQSSEHPTKVVITRPCSVQSGLELWSETQDTRIALEGSNSLIYAVGHCPPGGFANEVDRPLSSLPLFRMEDELFMHVYGPLNVFRNISKFLSPGSHIVFMTTAATRLLQAPDAAVPPKVQIYGHLAAIAAQDALVVGMRRDPITIGQGFKINRVGPPAIIDSPFHDCKMPEGMRSPITVTTKDVVDTVMASLQTEKHHDAIMLQALPT